MRKRDRAELIELRREVLDLAEALGMASASTYVTSPEWVAATLRGFSDDMFDAVARS